MVRNTARVVRFTGLLSAALSTGVFFGTRTSLSPSSKGFTPSTWVEVQQATICTTSARSWRRSYRGPSRRTWRCWPSRRGSAARQPSRSH